MSGLTNIRSSRRGGCALEPCAANGLHQARCHRAHRSHRAARHGSTTTRLSTISILLRRTGRRIRLCCHRSVGGTKPDRGGCSCISDSRARTSPPLGGDALHPWWVCQCTCRTPYSWSVPLLHLRIPQREPTCLSYFPSRLSKQKRRPVRSPLRRARSLCHSELLCARTVAVIDLQSGAVARGAAW